MTSRRHPLVAICHSAYARERAEWLWPDAPILGPVANKRGIRSVLVSMARLRPGLAYLVDVGATTVVAGIVARALGTRLVVDTGDVAHALAKSVGGRGRAGLEAVRLGEAALLRSADLVVVRGTAHAELVTGRTLFAPDVAPPTAQPLDGEAVRQRLELDQRFVVGLVGSLVWAPALGVTYGWDLIQALTFAPPNVSAVIVGDGDGRGWLEGLAARLGVQERCRFTGRIPPSQVASTIAAMDVAVSTQSNDIVGRVRTTGKLPLYLACGRRVMATDVGEAGRILPRDWVLAYHGTIDRSYPARLGAEMARLMPSSPQERRVWARSALQLSHEHFSADAVRRRVHDAILPMLGSTISSRPTVT